MGYLVFVSLLWAFSFGLIKGQLAGVDPGYVAAIRLSLCFITFLPLVFWFKSNRSPIKLMALGALQFGVMYIAYIQSYQYLPGYLVAVFTIFTPIYVFALNAFLEKRFDYRHALIVALSILGAAIMVAQSVEGNDFIIGFMLLQVANLAFGCGQVLYVRYCKLHRTDKNGQQSSDGINLMWMYFGAALLASIYTISFGDFQRMHLKTEQLWVVLYLGVISSALGFYCWNKGATQVSNTTLAVMNNAYMPFAVIFAFTLFGEDVDFARLLAGGSCIVMSIVLSVYLTNRQINQPGS
ncbi:EamA family transporter [Thalassotalea litorea]|uniref:EamA family transporter n=1 Tax=Thalassotalea litorea TaxID=2020715 RepID=A0A5R9IM86_9GAMM|nr:EamA family transporter [Thalassotalea litorea]TLU65699.1 EamA family transporter [Thalassotalea litorea]